MDVKLYGINTCDKVRYATKWLSSNNISYVFFDLKTVNTVDININIWLEKTTWSALINKKSTTWRSLSEKIKTRIIDNKSAEKVMRQYPLIIKRPIIEFGELIIVGFSEENFKKAFK
jgi:Spx/MgsR family transcriptional regulator